MKAKLRTIGIVLAALLLAMLLGILVTTVDADGPQLWQEKCPTQHYELRVEQFERSVWIVSCVRMAEEVNSE
jgi:hypothetical protein